jgi:Patatin-like phospholipase
MPKRLAITIAGAVSLGSYEAGVLYELLEAIRTNNEQSVNEDHKIYVDVLAGASAGGMTAGMVAQSLMYNADALRGETSNVLYQAWVERISLLGLVRMHWNELKWHSLFSSDLISSIGHAMLVASMQHPGSGPHAAVALVNGVPETIRLGLALTNLNGVDYMIPIVGSDEGGFNYTTSLDQKLFELKADGQPDSGKWKQMCTAAVGSGAFPAAFRPQALKHAVEEYGKRLPTDKTLWQQGTTYVDWAGRKDVAYFAHSDGGVLQNQPLGITKNLVDMTVAEREARIGQRAHSDSADRLYVFVTPRSVKSSAQHLNASEITIWSEIKHLVRVYMRQATFHDWITAEAVNQKVRVLDARAGELADIIMQGELDIAALAKASGDLNAMLMPNQQQQRMARLREQYSVKYKEVVDTAGATAGEVFISAIATLEAAAHLEDRDKMKIIAVIADAHKELAGAGIGLFVGFFKKSFRKHDYWVGRMKARTYLQRADVKRILDVTSWPDEASWQPALPNPTSVTLPLSNFQVLRAAIVPVFIMFAIRPVLIISSLALASLISIVIWALLHV